MKKLSRVNSITCLNGFKSGKDAWEDAPKDLIWEELYKMQGGLCAYCECKLNRKHIEHFKCRKSYPNETFSWDNLFGSCGDSSKQGGWPRCGIFKDSGKLKYDIEKVIKPDVDNPDDYLLFLTSGKVTSKNNISELDTSKAEETIKVFNLNNDPRLVNSRATTLKTYLEEIKTFYELCSDCDCDDLSNMLRDNLESIKGQEFETAIRHAWIYNEEY